MIGVSIFYKEVVECPATMKDRSSMNRLHEAKLELVKQIWSDPKSVMWALVELANECQQEAIDNGSWTFPERLKEVRKSEVLPMTIEEDDLCWDEDRGVGMVRRAGKWEDIPISQWLDRHNKEVINE